MIKKHEVKFKAHVKVKKPIIVSFKTEQGKKVVFPAHKKVKKSVVVDFKAKNKKK